MATNIIKFDINSIKTAYNAYIAEDDSRKDKLATFQDFLTANNLSVDHVNEVYKYVKNENHVLVLDHKTANAKKHPFVTRLVKSGVVPVFVSAFFSSWGLGSIFFNALPHGSQVAFLTVTSSTAMNTIAFAVPAVIFAAATTAVFHGINTIVRKINMNKEKKAAQEFVKYLAEGKNLEDNQAFNKLIASIENRKEFVLNATNSKNPFKKLWSNFYVKGALRDDIHKLTAYTLELAKRVKGINGISDETEREAKKPLKESMLKALTGIYTLITNDIQQSKLNVMLTDHKPNFIQKIFKKKARQTETIANKDLYGTLNYCLELALNGSSLTKKELEGRNTTAKSRHGDLVIENGCIPQLKDFLIANGVDLSSETEDADEVVEDTLEDEVVITEELTDEVVEEAVKTPAMTEEEKTTFKAYILTTKPSAFTEEDIDKSLELAKEMKDKGFESLSNEEKRVYDKIAIVVAPDKKDEITENLRKDGYAYDPTEIITEVITEREAAKVEVVEETIVEELEKDDDDLDAIIDKIAIDTEELFAEDTEETAEVTEEVKDDYVISEGEDDTAEDDLIEEDDAEPIIEEAYEEEVIEAEDADISEEVVEEIVEDDAEPIIEEVEIVEEIVEPKEKLIVKLTYDIAAVKAGIKEGREVQLTGTETTTIADDIYVAQDPDSTGLLVTYGDKSVVVPNRRRNVDLQDDLTTAVTNLINS